MTRPSSPVAPLAHGGLWIEEPVEEGEVAVYPSLIEAELARGLLEAAGIVARVVDGNTVSVAPTLASAIGGVKLRVAREDIELARAVLTTTAQLDEDFEGWRGP